MRAIMLGDLHLLGLRFLETYVKDPDDMAYKALAGVVRYAKKNRIKRIIQLGDVFHHPSPSQHDQRRLLRFIENSGLQWFIILGNHDILEAGKHSLVLSEFHSEKLPDQLRIITKPEVITLDGVPVCFLPWPHTETLLTSQGITCAHLTVQGCRLDSGLSLKKKGAQIGAKKGFWYLGDIHRAQTLGGWGRYVGTPYQRTFGEALPKGFCDVSARVENGKLFLKDRFIVQTPPYELVNLVVDCDEDLSKIKPFDPDNLTLYKLRVQGGYKLPSTFLKDNPQIYDADQGRGERKAAVAQSSQAPSPMLDSDDPLADLASFLKARGLSDAQIQRGLDKAEGYIRRHA